MLEATQTLISEVLQSQGIHRWGTASVEKPHSFEHYRHWIDGEKHGEMAYLKNHLPQKEFPDSLLPRVRSALVIAVDYFPTHPSPKDKAPTSALPIAYYARGHDYHHWLKAKLMNVIESLKAHFPDQEFLGMTDSHPVMERDLARRAGLGWFGKNTCLIDAKSGSLFLIGEIFTSLDFKVAITPSPDQCGTCRRCLDACPTQAFDGERQLDARKCISYWTIEARGTPPAELRPQIGAWFFGCDICQQVCPWNEKVFGRTLMQDEQTKPADLNELERELRWVLTASNNQLLKAFAGTPLTRSGGKGLKRNAILMAAHHKLTALAPEIANVGATFPELAELSAWALQEGLFLSLANNDSI